jgi:hypothetical protein
MMLFIHVNLDKKHANEIPIAKLDQFSFRDNVLLLHYYCSHMGAEI